MTHRKSSNVCPVCGAQVNMVAYVTMGTKSFGALGGYIAECRCENYYPPQQTKKLAWVAFRSCKIGKLRAAKNRDKNQRVTERIIKRVLASSKNANR
mgnify:CR=1 FL=1